MSVPAYHESLPYIDTLSPEDLLAARALIAAETSSSPNTSPLKTTPKSPSFTPALQTELLRIASSTPLTPLDTKRYEAQDLPPTSTTQETAPILSKAYTSAAYLSSRLQNLQLLEKHGANAWLLSNYHLEATLKEIEADLADTKRQIDEVNAARQRRQGNVKGEMVGLEDAWRKGVGRVLETEIAAEEMRAAIREELRKRGGA
ncbi:hypothetical protein VFPPC_12706 [Pochonia chlamydosporia 170]|uniref:BCAS2 family protein n=1 Tax=Pochonia chlamydosporia 170 TaxID=1380566 RepID=A0A179G2P2_METCM|nr:hypothetical protein VFPPC_12706 [Pochonia chlamydosporia 170]OAQ72116.1 hypothetical protein VFPPC_12706 [Pochonia chlamydosporia 170]